MTNYLTEVMPTELLLSLSDFLPVSALYALTRTCCRTHTIFQPKLDATITFNLHEKLIWVVTKNKPYALKKLLVARTLQPGNEQCLLLANLLHIPAVNGYTEIASILLDAGVNPSVDRTRGRDTLLHLAVRHRQPEIIKLLFAYGVNPDIHAACDSGAFRNGDSASPLQWASAKGDLELVKLLLENGARLEDRGHYGTALGFAVRTLRTNVVRFLLGKGAKADVMVPLTKSHAKCRTRIIRPREANLVFVAFGIPKYRQKWNSTPQSRKEFRKRHERRIRRVKVVRLLMDRGASNNDAMLSMQARLFLNRQLRERRRNRIF